MRSNAGIEGKEGYRVKRRRYTNEEVVPLIVMMMIMMLVFQNQILNRLILR